MWGNYKGIAVNIISLLYFDCAKKAILVNT